MGRHMYQIYGRSQVVINRHGEVAQGYSNNLRIFEAPGMNALLMTEASPNIVKLNPYAGVYAGANGLCESLERILTNYENYRQYAKWGY